MSSTPAGMHDTASDAIAARLVEGGAAAVRKIFFRDLALDIAIGVHAAEQGRTQRVHLNLDIYLTDTAAPRTDRLAEVFDYDRIRTGVLELVAGRHINLQETLVEEVAAYCLAFDAVRAVRVASEKVDIYPDVAGVGVALVRFKAG
jgi:7,8-dihydroneopterin aldolase/epimerase/oxygenase